MKTPWSCSRAFSEAVSAGSPVAPIYTGRSVRLQAWSALSAAPISCVVPDVGRRAPETQSWLTTPATRYAPAPMATLLFVTVPDRRGPRQGRQDPLPGQRGGRSPSCRRPGGRSTSSSRSGRSQAARAQRGRPAPTPPSSPGRQGRARPRATPPPMLARMSRRCRSYTVGVLQKDDPFRTMAPTVTVLLQPRRAAQPQLRLGPEGARSALRHRQRGPVAALLGRRPHMPGPPADGVPARRGPPPAGRRCRGRG